MRRGVAGAEMSYTARPAVQSRALLPGVAIAGLLRQGYTQPSSFLRPPRFDHTLSIPAPAAPNRLRLLQGFLKPHSPTDADLRYLAEVPQFALRSAWVGIDCVVVVCRRLRAMCSGTWCG